MRDGTGQQMMEGAMMTAAHACVTETIRRARMFRIQRSPTPDGYLVNTRDTIYRAAKRLFHMIYTVSLNGRPESIISPSVPPAALTYKSTHGLLHCC